MVTMDISTDLVKNYSKCPLKKRPVMIEEPIADIDVEVVLDDEQCEPENLSTKPEDLSRNSDKYAKRTEINNNVSPVIKNETNATKQEERIYVPKPTYPKRVEMPLIKEEHDTSYLAYPSVQTNWCSPLTPPISYATANENMEPANWQHPNNYPAKIEPHHHQSHHHQHPLNHVHQFTGGYLKEENNNIYKSMPLYNPYTTVNTTAVSLDLRTSGYNPNIMKSELFVAAAAAQNPKRFTPYRVDRPLFNIFPLSPASSQASSYNSYESPRRSVSPISTNSSLSEHLPANYSVFQNVAMPPPTSAISSTTVEQVSPSKLKDKSSKSAHYQCPDCSKSYSTYSGLSKHLQFHCPAVEGNQAKKHFSCKNCDKVYTSLGALKMHIRTHTLPCKCDICGKAFSRPWLLQGHIRTHTGEKPFTCQHCHRAFADRSNLRAHLQTHSEIKKYSCTTCAKTFSRMSLLTKHMEVGCPGYQHNSHQGLGYPIGQPNTTADISVY